MSADTTTGTTSTWTRRSALAVIVGSASALLGACATPAAAPATQVVVQPTATAQAALATAKPQGVVQPTSKPQTQPRLGGTLRAALQTDLPNVDPHFNAPSAYDALWVAFDRLIYLDDKLQPQPMLAESWDVTPDFKRVTFRLRKGVQFSTGRELTSEDIKYNLLRVRDPKVGAGGFVGFSNWWTIDTPDKYTITLASDVSRPLLFDNLETFNIIDQVTAEGANAKSQAVGTGPFVLKEWVPGDHVTLVKNNNYWQPGRPYLDTIEYKILRDAQTMMAHLEAGALDMVLNPPLRDIARLKGDPKYQAATNPNTGRFYVAGWNVASSPLNNKLVRQALNFAMNRQRFVDTILVGLSRPMTLPWGAGSPAFEEPKANFFKYDLDKAKALLSQVGVGPLPLDYLISPNFPELLDFGQVYQADLATIGVTLTIKQAESAAFFDAINKRTYAGMYSVTSARAQLAPGITFSSTATFNSEQNNEGFSSDAYTQLARATATETDPQKLKQVYTQMNDLLLDEAFASAIASAPPRVLLKSNVQGLAYTMHEGFDWTNVWLT
jgi:peptide/nickel transport system substrate-binding protein